MKEQSVNPKSPLVRALREAVAIVQMVFFKELRTSLTARAAAPERSSLAMLAGTITNEVFGSHNPEERFVRFRREHRGIIEQELLNLRTEQAQLLPILTDALRIQTLCDHQEGDASSSALQRAKEFGYLVEEREIPLPSSFMTTVRELGKEHNLIVPPVEIRPDQDNPTVN